MFLLPRDPLKELWEGKMTGLEGAKEVYGAHQVIEFVDLNLIILN